MIKRGRILRDTNSGAGLISADGVKYEFQLEKTWDSDLAPKVGMIVEIELDENGALLAVWAISEEDLAKEQAGILLNSFKEKSLVYFNTLSELVGKPVLFATAALFLGWFFLSTVNIDLGVLGGQKNISITFWQILAIVNNVGNVASLMQGGIGGDRGIYGFLFIAALIGPFIFIFWKHPLAHLGNCLALFLILFVIGSSYMSYLDQMNVGREAMNIFGGAKSKEMMESIADQAWQQAMKMINIGIGAYISIAASAFLAFIGSKKFLIALAGNNLDPKSSNSRSSSLSGRRSAQPTLYTTQVAPIEPVVQNVISRSCHACHVMADQSASFCEACGTKLT